MIVMSHLLCVAVNIYNAVDFTQQPKDRCFFFELSYVNGSILIGVFMLFFVSQMIAFSVRIICKAKAQQRKIFVQRMIVSRNENNPMSNISSARIFAFLSLFTYFLSVPLVGFGIFSKLADATKQNQLDNITRIVAMVFSLNINLDPLKFLIAHLRIRNAVRSYFHVLVEKCRNAN